MKLLITSAIVFIAVIFSGCITPVAQEAIDVRNATAAEAVDDSVKLGSDVEAQLLELFTLKSEAAYAQLQSKTEKKLGNSQSTSETVSIMNEFYSERESLNRVLTAEAEGHATYVEGIHTLGYGIKTLNEMANEEAKVANEPLVKLAVAGFKTDLFALIAKFEERYAPKVPTPVTQPEPKVEETTE